MAKIAKSKSIPVSQGLSYDAQTIITIICLLFVYPIGVILMFAWMGSWPSWIKVLIAIPFLMGIIALILLFGGVIGSSINGPRSMMMY